MAEYKRTETGIEGLCIIEPQIFGDKRGFFMETYTKRDFEKIGITYDFVQDNHSKSSKGVLRGLHFQTEHSQDKLVRVIKGAIYDVAVDLRQNSPTYGRYYGLELSEDNRRLFFIPKGFAHGFLALTDDVEFLYKVTDYYYPGYDSGIIWNDPDLKIEWPLKKYSISEPILSDKDKNLGLYRDAKEIKS